MKKYTSILAVSLVSLLFSACDKPEITSSHQSESAADKSQTEAQKKLISDQAARIKELEDQEKQRQADRISELELREQELLASLAEQKRLAEEAAKLVEEIPHPDFSGEPVVAVEVPENFIEPEVVWEPLEPIVSAGDELPITDIGYDFDYLSDYYDPGYQPPLVEHIDYHAYVSYDWYQYHIVRERSCLQREADYGIQIRSLLLEILRAKLAYENHKKIKHDLRDHLWHSNLVLLEKKWHKYRAREREVLTLRQQLKKINTDRLRIANERDRRLKEARRHPGWKELELRKKQHVESQRKDLVDAWKNEKKLRQKHQQAFLVRAKPGKAVVVKPHLPVNPIGVIEGDKKQHGKIDSQAAARLRELQKDRERLGKDSNDHRRDQNSRGKREELKPISRSISAAGKDAQAPRIKPASNSKEFDMKSELERLHKSRRANELAKKEQEAKENALKMKKAKEAAERANREKVEQERLERVRRARESVDREASEKAARSKYKLHEHARRAKESAEKAAREKAARERAAKERVAREKAAREKAERERAERARQEQLRKAEAEEARRRQAAEEAKRRKEIEEKSKKEKDEKRNPRGR